MQIKGLQDESQYHNQAESDFEGKVSERNEETPL